MRKYFEKNWPNITREELDWLYDVGTISLLEKVFGPEQDIG